MAEQQVTILAVLKDNLSGPLNSVRTALRRLFDAFRGVGSLLTAPFRLLSNTLGFIRDQVFSLRGILVAGLGAAITRTFTEFERSFTPVVIQVGEGADKLEELKDGILALARETGDSFSSLNRGLETTVAAGVAAQDALGVVERAAKLAAASGTDTATAVEGLLVVMNSYGLSAKEAGRISDLLFQTWQDGVTEVGELSRSLGFVASTANLAGLSMEELFGSISTLTLAGDSTSVAINAIRALLVSLISPTAEASQLARELGINFNTSAIQGGRFVEFLQEVAEKTGRSETLINQLFGNIRAFSAVVKLTANDGASLTRTIDNARNAAGAANAGFEKFSATLSQGFARLKATVLSFFVEVGAAAAPFLNQVVDRLQAFFERLATSRNTIQAVIQVVAAVLTEVANVVRTLFVQGDVLTFVFNSVSAGLQLLVRLFLDAIPGLVATMQLIGRQIAQALLKSFFGHTEEQLARAAARGGVLAVGIRAAVGGDTFQELQQTGSALQKVEAEIARLQETLRTGRVQRAPGEKGSILDALGVDPERVKRDLADLQAQREQILAGFQDDVFTAVTQQDVQRISSSFDQLISGSRDAFAAAIQRLTVGLQDPTKDAIAQLLATAFGAPDLLERAGAKDALERQARQAAATAAKAASDAASSTTGAAAAAAEERAASQRDPAKEVAVIKQAVDDLNVTLDRSLHLRARAQQLLDEGYISTREGRQRDQEARAAFEEALAAIEQRIARLRESGENPALVENLLRPIEAALDDIRLAAEQANRAVSEDFLAGFEAGLRNTAEQLDEFREVGLSAGAQVADGLTTAIVDVWALGQRKLREFLSSFLIAFGRMIAQAQIFRGVMAAIGLFGGGAGGVDPGVANGFQLATPNRGGLIRRFRWGGPVPGPNVNRDVVPALLTPGEHVITREAVRHYGASLFAALNRMLIPKHALEGLGRGVSVVNAITRRFAHGGEVSGAAALAGAGGGMVRAVLVPDEQTWDRQKHAGRQAEFRFAHQHAQELRASMGLGNPHLR